MNTPTPQSEEELEQEARALLAQIEGSQALFSAKAQELVAKLSVEAKSLDTDTEKLEASMDAVADEADAELQQATQEFMTEDEDEEEHAS